jgi:galactose mutarotase-like enzyme
MNKFETPSQSPKIEKIQAPDKGEVSFSSERGGIITSVKLNGVEILYLDQETFSNKDVSVKGGIPILFPNAGPIPEEIKTEEYINLKQHGFARDMKWMYKNNENSFFETLISDENTKRVYSHDFKLTLRGVLEKDGSFTLTKNIQNLNENQEMPVSGGLHPYFKVTNEQKQNIEFNFPGGDFIKENIEKWANGKAVSIDNPKEPLEISIPNLGTLVLTVDEEYKKIWVWSMPDKDFICIEPVMHDKGGIITEPTMIKPKEDLTLLFNLKLKGI